MPAWLISLITGGVGGNIAGALLRKYSLGFLGNTIAGILGGGLGDRIIGGMMGAGDAAGGGGMGIGGHILGSGLGGAILMIIIGVIKQMITGKKAAA
jgi:hypothetical protein